jgi:hypothetical protein
MRMELQATRSLVFSGLLERDVIEPVGMTGRAGRTKLYRLVASQRGSD